MTGICLVATLGLALLHLHAGATPIISMSDPVARPSERYISYPPVPSLLLSDYEVRGTTRFSKSGARDHGLRASESFYWGPSNNPVANVTAFAGDDTVKILSMERFQDLASVQCFPRSVKLAFDAQNDFYEVKQHWSWVNDAAENYIVFVTDNGCLAMEDLDPRQAWHVTHATFDYRSKTITLNAEPKDWEDAFEYWHLRLSSTGILPYSLDHQPAKRDDEGFSIDLGHDFSSEPQLLDDDGDSVTTIACSPCNTAGSINFDIDVDLPSLSGSVTITPSGLSATLTTKLATENEMFEGVSKTTNLLDIPTRGVKIKMFEVGVYLHVDLLASVDAASAGIEISTGATFAISDDSSALMTFNDDTPNSATGLVPILVPDVSEPSLHAGASLTASAGLQIRVELDATFKGKGKGISAGIAIDPRSLKFTIDGDAVLDTCAGDASVDVDISLEEKVVGYGGFGAATDKPNAFDIYSTATNIYTTCIAADLPGLGSASSSTTSVTPSGLAGAPSGSAGASSGVAVNPSRSTGPWNSASAQPSASRSVSQPGSASGNPWSSASQSWSGAAAPSATASRAPSASADPSYSMTAQPWSASQFNPSFTPTRSWQAPSAPSYPSNSASFSVACSSEWCPNPSYYAWSATYYATDSVSESWHPSYIPATSSGFSNPYNPSASAQPCSSAVASANPSQALSWSSDPAYSNPATSYLPDLSTSAPAYPSASASTQPWPSSQPGFDLSFSAEQSNPSSAQPPQSSSELVGGGWSVSTEPSDIAVASSAVASSVADGAYNSFYASASG